ncbi:MAG: endonuclease III [Candidatus Sungbacteria bacterium RIFCSPLOWO2_02_FULL_48_13b]|uniref:Endonuclease III n=2 Tax=Candidatus Sungiibacteriota TaxID=1817917 RepID=A0A1G2LII2_9BACT|nr:MAG: endonuclease III [Candidatus Sungbacteria bacterium RIFCSPHIGHO2_02_FULL_49_20]OHA11453.1 MAG: endonuclease III [Candidatus Sungbacteria bacterium RIFCSPLOWO2_02_FULL_48_13b]
MGEYNEYTKSWVGEELFGARQKRAAKIFQILEKHNPHSKTALHFQTPMQLLAAVILSAQSTDKKVNEITDKHLFKKYKTPKDFARAQPKTFEKEISQIGLFRSKAKNIIASAKMISRKFGGKLPKTMEEMITLRGVARKTANIVLWNAYGIISGIAIDTHARRLAQRLGLTENDDPSKIEKDLMALVPNKKLWPQVNTLLVDLGRSTCIAQNPRCRKCPLKAVCPSSRV